MKILLLCDYPAGPGGLATQGELLYKGLLDAGVDVCPVHLEATTEKEWYYRWFKPDVALGIGCWGHSPYIVMHPRRHGITPVPWLVADGYVANYLDVLNALPLILVTSHWVKEVYVRDGVRPDIIEVLPVGCDTQTFVPCRQDDLRVQAMRESLGVAADECMILTVGGDAASKGAQEVIQALSSLNSHSPPWRYVCKVWPQDRTEKQNKLDLQLATHLGLESKVDYVASIMSRNCMPYLMAACDIYAGPSRLEGFGMPQVEAGACGKPVLGIQAMGMLDTLVHRQTALLARVAEENRISETVLGAESGFAQGRRVVFDPPRIADYRANVGDIARYLEELIRDPGLRRKLGDAGRTRVVEHFDYRVVAKKLVRILSDRLGIP